jgi:hypothetical protein
MRKLLLWSLLCLCAALPASAQTVAKYGTFNVSCANVTATGVCAYFPVPLFNGYTVVSNYTWQTICTGTCTTISVTFEGSVDGRTSLDGVATSGNTTFTSASLNFIASDKGKTIYIGGAKTAGATFATTISSVTNATTVVLAASPNLSIVGAPTFVGTFAVLDTSTNTAGETRSVVNNAFIFVRCNVGTLTGAGATVQCGMLPKGS